MHNLLPSCHQGLGLLAGLDVGYRLPLPRHHQLLSEDVEAHQSPDHPDRLLGAEAPAPVQRILVPAAVDHLGALAASPDLHQLQRCEPV